MATERSAPWGLVVAAGAVSLAAGIALIAWPGPSLEGIALIVGINLVCLSAVQLVGALLSPVQEGHRLTTALLAIAWLVAGLVVLRRPGDSLEVVAIAVGACFAFVGVVRLLALDGRGQRGPL